MLVYACNSDVSVAEEAIDYDALELEFLEQTFFSDSIFGELLLLENAKEIHFGELNLFPSRYFSENDFDKLKVHPSRPFHNFKESILVSDEDLINIFVQVEKNNNDFNWNSVNLNREKIITRKELEHINEISNFLKIYESIHKYLGKGILSISKPIFFNNGNFAFVKFDASWDWCKGDNGFCLYQKEKGKWKLVRSRMLHTIC